MCAPPFPYTRSSDLAALLGLRHLRVHPEHPRAHGIPRHEARHAVGAAGLEVEHVRELVIADVAPVALAAKARPQAARAEEDRALRVDHPEDVSARVHLVVVVEGALVDDDVAKA